MTHETFHPLALNCLRRQRMISNLPVPANPLFFDNNRESLSRKCIVFPADGSETRIVDMIVREVVTYPLRFHTSYVVDMASKFGDEERKMRVQSHEFDRNGVESTYLFVFNLSPYLPINLNVAQVIGVTPSHLKATKQLFWTGDVVAMKARSRLALCVESLDAELLDSTSLEDFFREGYRERFLDGLLRKDEYDWALYCDSTFRLSSQVLLGAWRTPEEKEVNFLQDLNELRYAIGRPPHLPHFYKKDYMEHPPTAYVAGESVSHRHQKVVGPPKLPPELECCIFRMCALENPEARTVLVLVARRVHVWIDPILISTIYMKGVHSDRLQELLAKFMNGKPVEYYAENIKNLAIHGEVGQDEVLDRILTICTGVENLLLWTPIKSDLAFLDNPQAGSKLRRLSIEMACLFRKSKSTPNFYHPCFANLTHLHICDQEREWYTYAGWEALVSLTHLAFAPKFNLSSYQTMQLMPKLPTVQYVALGSYRANYVVPAVDNRPHRRAEWGVRVVWLSDIPDYDWKRGARGGGDFWVIVEREVKRRLAEESLE